MARRNRYAEDRQSGFGSEHPGQVSSATGTGDNAGQTTLACAGGVFEQQVGRAVGRYHTRLEVDAEVFQLLGFSQFFNIKENLEEAVAFFAQKGEALQAGPFPKIFKCPICSKKLKAVKPGRFRCSECKTILAIDNAGQVLLG